MHQRIRRFAPLALALLALAAVGSGPVAVSASNAADAAETEMIRLINQDRADHGLVPYRRDGHLMHIAGTRSWDMATKHYFSHRQPDGRTAFDMIDALGITWYVAGEDIAWNNYSDLNGSAVMANNQWLASSPHRAAILSTSYNYVGVGVAVDTSNGHKLWTAVFMKAPDHTGGWVKFNQPTDVTAGGDSTPTSANAATTSTASTSSRSVTISWLGGDVRLATLTSGFDHYQVLRRVDSGSWITVTRSTTARSRTFTAYPGHVYRWAVRACDHRGNCGPWQYATVTA
jgi:uncharacterized protein YkwD